jgi:hypothetical protein
LLPGNYRATSTYSLFLQHLTKKTTAHAPSIYTILFLLAATATQAQNWNQIIKAAASDRGQGLVTDRTVGDQLGYSVAISGDYAIVGATGDDQNVLGQSNQSEAGSVYIFKQTAGVWALQQK